LTSLVSLLSVDLRRSHQITDPPFTLYCCSASVVETLLLVPSSSPLPEATATSISVALRHQGLSQAIVHFAPSQGAVEISRVSEATERLYVAPAGGEGARRKMMSSDAAGATTVDEERVLKRLVWVAAQRVSRDEKIATAIAKGRVAVL
jgi:hypothetical protein